MIWKPLMDLRSIKLTRNLPRRLPFKFTAPRSMFHATVNGLQNYVWYAMSTWNCKAWYLIYATNNSKDVQLVGLDKFVYNFYPRLYIHVYMCVCVTKPVHHNLIGNQRHIHFQNNECHSEMYRSSSENKWIWKMWFIEFVIVTHVEKIKSNLHFQNIIWNLIAFQSIISATAEIISAAFSAFPWCIWSMVNSWHNNIYWLYKLRLAVNAGLILGMHPANEIRRYFATNDVSHWPGASLEPALLMHM